MKTNYKPSLSNDNSFENNFQLNTDNNNFNNTICNLINASKCQEMIDENMEDFYPQSETSLNVITNILICEVFIFNMIILYILLILLFTFRRTSKS